MAPRARPQALAKLFPEVERTVLPVIASNLEYWEAGGAAGGVAGLPAAAGEPPVEVERRAIASPARA